MFEDGERIPLSEVGEIPDGVAERVARPSTYADEEFVYNEQIWEVALEDGGVEQGYRITRHSNDASPSAPIWQPTVVDPALLEYGNSAAPGQILEVHIRLRDFPEWDIPPRASSLIASAADLETAAARRDAAMVARQTLAENMTSELAYAIETAGGEVIAVRGSSGWVWAEIPAAAIGVIVERTDVERVRLPNSEMIAAAWRQGDGRWPTRMNADIYHAAGFDGGIGNPDTHGLSRLNAVVIEALPAGQTVAGFEDEACAFYDGANCTGITRISARYKCDLGGAYPCHFVLGGFAEAEEGNHGTAVSAAILADYQAGQGCGFGLNDPAWVSGCHDSDWMYSATGMAPNAYLQYFAGWGSGWPGSGDASYSHAIHWAYANNQADVINASWGFTPGCEEDPSTEVHDEAENAFDDGSLLVAAAGNLSGPSSSCNVWSPAGLIKTLAVNAFDAVDPVACQTDYHSMCLVDDLNSAKGGITANVTGTTRANALTTIDLIAPNEAIRYTSDVNANGDVTNTTQAAGTSYATPTVAGLALLVKHRMLYYGNTFVNSPGRLQTIMLALGDRHYSTWPTNKATATIQKSTGGDILYGFGRPKLRKFIGSGEAPTSWTMLTWVTQSSTYTAFPLGVLPANTDFFKCVLLQHEDLSGAATSIANFNLRLRVFPPVSGSCSSSGVQVGSTVEDTSYDSKSMAALEDSVSRPLAGNCVEVRILPVTADRLTATTTFCYYSGLIDDEDE